MLTFYAVTGAALAAVVLLGLALHRQAGRRPVPHVVQVAERYGHRGVVALYPVRSRLAGLVRLRKLADDWDPMRYQISLHRVGDR